MATDHGTHGFHHHDVAYEKTDLGHRGIWVFFIFLAVAALVIHLAVWAMYKGFGAVTARLQSQPSPLVQQQAPVRESMIQNIARVDVEKYPEPRLQPNDTMDMNRFNQYEDRVLKAQPWRDQSGAIHLPIDVAMKAIAQRGLPSRANAADPSQPNPMVVPTDSGFPGFAAAEQPSDATAVPGAPMGDTTGPSKREEIKPIPGVDPNSIRNPSRPEAAPKGQEQPVKTPPPSGNAGRPMSDPH